MRHIQPSKLTTKQRPSSPLFLMQQRTGPRYTSHTAKLHTKVLARVNALHGLATTGPRKLLWHCTKHHDKCLLSTDAHTNPSAESICSIN